MNRMGYIRIGVVLLGIALIMPVVASAQQAGGIAGEVVDDTGGVLPGVTVEATSPVLIEGVRTAFTDGEGRYSIVNLVPGTYSVSFSLPGFSTIIREGVELASGFTANIDASMQVGGIEETITVTGASPVVDVQNVRQQTVVSEALLEALPTGTKGLMSVVRLIPGLNSGAAEDGGGAGGIYASNRVQGASIHGKGGSKQTYDGVNTLNLAGTGNTTYIMNMSTVAEVVVETGGVSAENDSSGVAINMIPKEGGNSFNYSFDTTYANEHLQGDNLSDRLRDRGLERPSQLIHAYDLNGTVGGPIRQDRLWFFTATRFQGTKNEYPILFFNDTRGTPVYTRGAPAFAKDYLKAQASRITWQVSESQKINAFADVQSYQTRGTGNNTAPEAQTCWNMWPVGMYNASWTSPVTSRLLLEAGAGLSQGRFPCTREDVTDTYDFVVDPTDVSIQEASTGLVYNAKTNYRPINNQDRYTERFSLSYVTGSHTLKTGFQLQQHRKDVQTVINQDVRYRFNQGVPNRVTLYATPYQTQNNTNAELGLYVQDRWAIDRFTVNLGLRLDYFNGSVPAQDLPATQFVAARSFDPVSDAPDWTDINPRLGVSYDLFGDGRTALKTSLGRYVGKMGTNVAEALNPVNTSVNNVNRSWSDANGDFVPDCELTNFDANGECGAISNNNFGQSNPGAVQYADDMISGFGTRDNFWDFSAEVQHELAPGVSFTGGYYRNWSSFFGSAIDAGYFSPGDWRTASVNDNLSVGPEDFDPFCITAPMDPGLPGGGGYEVCGLYDITPEKFGVGEVLVSKPSNFGDGQHRTADFFTFSLNSQFGNGTVLGGSLDTGRIVEDNCFVVDSPQKLLHCRVTTPFKSQTQVKLHGSHALPGDFIVSGIFKNIPGAFYNANYNVRNDEIAPSLGRNLAACGTRTVCTASVSVPLIAPQTGFEPRRTVLDLRLTKVFAFSGGGVLRANLDVYNVMNNSGLLRLNHAFGSSWRLPQGYAGGITPPRLLQFGAQLEF